MRLLPKDASDRWVLPILLWVPIGLVSMFGLQAARSGEEAASTLPALGIISAVMW